jgi:Fibronectin type III domain
MQSAGSMDAAYLTGFKLLRVPTLLQSVVLASLFLWGSSTLAADPPDGTLTDAHPTLTYTGGPYVTTNATGQAQTPPACAAPMQCDVFTLTVNVSASDAQTKEITISTGWPNSTADFDLYVIDSSGNLVGVDANSADPEVAVIPAVSGRFTIQIVPFNPLGQTFTTTISLGPIPPKGANGSGAPPRFQTYLAPVSAGGAESSGEPSIGVDWNPNIGGLQLGSVNSGGVTFFTANLHEFRVNFDDCSSPAGNKWEDVTSPIETATTLDPIGLCDHFGSGRTPGRIFQSQLAGATSLLAFSDNDGETWTQSQGSGQPAGVDHQTLGVGPFNPGSIPPPPPHPLYANAVYYCSQDIVTAFCSRSDDGGLTFGAGVPIYNLTTCGGIHGHVKVAPDGTVYVPNASCGANQAASVSTDNGITWTVRAIPDSVSGNTDPSVGIASNGAVYFGYQSGTGPSYAKIAVSHDRGLNWSPSVDAGAPFGIQNAVFPEVVAGDPNRAAFMFLGTTGSFNYQDTANFKGIWHTYIATTYDGGKSYITVNTNPENPVQVGSICNSGINCSGGDRNLLDFNDLTMDSRGRIVGGYANGCIPGACDASSPSFASRGAVGTIVRQSGGRTLLASFDTVEPNAPAAPEIVSALRYSNGVMVNWLAPDSGGSPITGYKIFRGTVSGAETLLKSIKGTRTNYLDQSAKAGTQYFYRVEAVNSAGVSAFCKEVSATQPPPAQSACVLPGLTVLQDASGDQVGGAVGQNPQLDIQAVSVAEPFVDTNAPSKLYFTLKVRSLTQPLAPNQIWTVLFTTPDGVQRFVDMNTNTGTPAFEYGHVSGSSTTDGAADPASSFSADGTITIVIGNSLVGNPQHGDQLVDIEGETQLLVGGGGTGLLETTDTTRPGRYILTGNQGCALPK